VNHRIDGSVLVPRRRAKREFRQSILQAWEQKCAYCGKEAATLDHVLARSKGGETTRNNLISCCSSCNSRKGSERWVDWYRSQAFWDPEREGTILLWLNQENDWGDSLSA